jgi:hypothetical protein
MQPVPPLSNDRQYEKIGRIKRASGTGKMAAERHRRRQAIASVKKEPKKTKKKTTKKKAAKKKVTKKTVKKKVKKA